MRDERTRRHTVARRRRQQGQPAAAHAQPRAAGAQRRHRGKRPHRAGDASPRVVRPRAARHGDAGDERLPGPRAAQGRSAAARRARHRDVVARRHRQRRALHRARRRRLPAEAGQSGAAESAHRSKPREEAAARSAEGAAAPLRRARGRAGPAESGFALGGKHVRGLGDVLRHPRLHAARRVAAARGDDRAPQHLLHADVLRDQRPRRNRHADDRRRADGDIRRAAAAFRTTAKAPCARRSR